SSSSTTDRHRAPVPGAARRRVPVRVLAPRAGSTDRTGRSAYAPTWRAEVTHGGRSMHLYDQDADDDVLDRSAPRPVDVRRLVVVAAACLAVIGVAVGLAAAQPWSRLVEHDPVEPFAGTRTPPEAVRASLAEAARTDRVGSDPLDQPEVGEVARAVF